MTDTMMHSGQPHSGLASRGRGLLARYNAYLANRRHYNEVLSELRRLNDRELCDMGIGRADFDAIASGRFGR